MNKTDKLLSILEFKRHDSNTPEPEPEPEKSRSERYLRSLKVGDCLTYKHTSGVLIASKVFRVVANQMVSVQSIQQYKVGYGKNKTTKHIHDAFYFSGDYNNIQIPRDNIQIPSDFK